jgi:hypothetical protein
MKMMSMMTMSQESKREKEKKKKETKEETKWPTSRRKCRICGRHVTVTHVVTEGPKAEAR